MESLEGATDAELLQYALAGEEAAFLALYERLKGGVFRYAFYMTNSKPSAEEVTQEVFISLLKEGGRYRKELGDVGAFVFGITRNLVRRMERRERPYQPLPPDDAAEATPRSLMVGLDSLPQQMIRKETIEKVQAAIGSLPDHYRQAVVLCDLCELSYAEAASRLQCAVGTVRSRLNRAHALLARKLKPLKGPQPDIRATGREGWVL